MLFTRILQNTILDHFPPHQDAQPVRHQLSKPRWRRRGRRLRRPLEILESQDSAVGKDQPLAALEQGQAMGAIEEALAKLPARQREAFLLRYWEDMDTAETAAAMAARRKRENTLLPRGSCPAGLLRQKGITLWRTKEQILLPDQELDRVGRRCVRILTPGRENRASRTAWHGSSPSGDCLA